MICVVAYKSLCSVGIKKNQQQPPIGILLQFPDSRVPQKLEIFKRRKIKTGSP